ncbi:MAG TPA: PEP-CTERM sorting domain-containing protein [Bryobacteraceae bacterium]|jgi:hypothetical protein|nr:PEP-CTERM sorting domain-containing protein [Bryobacteraceae bacterium]
MKTYRNPFIRDFMHRIPAAFTIAVLATIALGTPRLAKANQIFAVDVMVGNGSVMGSIVTDGTLGTVGQGDFVGFDLTITSPGGSATATKLSDFFEFVGSDLSETSSDLIFNFSGTSGSGFTILSDDTTEAWSLGGGGYLTGICNTCDPNGTPGVEDDNRAFPVYYTQLSGDVAIGTTAAPEPGTLLLFSTGLIGLAVLRTRVRKPSLIGPSVVQLRGDLSRLRYFRSAR